VQIGYHRSPPPIGRRRNSWSAHRPALVAILGPDASVGQQQWDSLCSAQWRIRPGSRHPPLPFLVAGLAASNGGSGTVGCALYCQSPSLAASPPTAAAAQLPAPALTVPGRWPRRHQRRVLQSSWRPPVPVSVTGHQQSGLQHSGRDPLVPVPFPGRAATSDDSVSAAFALPCQPLAPESPLPYSTPPPPASVAVQKTFAGLRRLRQNLVTTKNPRWGVTGGGRCGGWVSSSARMRGAVSYAFFEKGYSKTTVYYFLSLSPLVHTTSTCNSRYHSGHLCAAPNPLLSLCMETALETACW